MQDYLREYLTFLTHAKWKFKLASSARLDLDRAWIRPTSLKFWAIEECDNIGRAYVFWFDDCGRSETQKVQFGNPAELLGLGLKFRDGDLCYCFREENDCLLVYELFYLETIMGKSGFVEYGIHKWVPSDVNVWKNTISNLVGKHYCHEEPGSSTEYIWKLPS